MGCAVSASRDKEADERSKNIDRVIMQDAARLRTEVKLLLLGEYLKQIETLCIRSGFSIVYYSVYCSYCKIICIII